MIVTRFVKRPFLVLDRLRTVFEESIFRSQDDLEFDPEAGAEKFKEILSAPGVPVGSDYMVSQISNSISIITIVIDLNKRSE